MKLNFYPNLSNGSVLITMIAVIAVTVVVVVTYLYAKVRIMMDASSNPPTERLFTLNDWDDDPRMHFMFSAFPKERNTNPKHWESKMGYWTEEIKRCCRAYCDVCIKCDLLSERFRRDGRVPQGLSIVIQQMEKEGLLIKKESMLKIFERTWLGWSYNVLKGSASWLLSPLWKNGLPDGKNEYVVLQTVEELGQEVLNKHYQTVKCDKTDHVVPWNVVKNLYITTKSNVKDEDVLLIIAHLKSKRLADLDQNSLGEKMVKFAKNISDTVVPVSENDWHIIRLKKAIAKLKIEAADIKKKINELKCSAKQCLQQKDRSEARRILSQRRKYETAYNLKQDTLVTLTNQLDTIQNTDSNKMILDAMNSSSAVLNASLEQDNINPDQIDEVFEKAYETTNLIKDIDISLAEGFKHLADDVDLEELENELADLLLEKDEEAEDPSRAMLDLPSVPTHSPIGTSAVKPKRKTAQDLPG